MKFLYTVKSFSVQNVIPQVSKVNFRMDCTGTNNNSLRDDKYEWCSSPKYLH